MLCKVKIIFTGGHKVNLVENIVKTEWNEFQKVENQGGRAACQDNKKGFEIARKSQFLTWNKDMLESYYEDLTNAIEQGRNLITEKYARMMESTAPEEYAQMKDQLPSVSIEKKNLIEEIVTQKVKWVEEFSIQYPRLSGGGRAIHTSDDKPYETSFETYLRGELLTYSERTIRLYHDYIKQLIKENKNLSTLIMENTIRLYGYDSLEAAESKV